MDRVTEKNTLAYFFTSSAMKKSSTWAGSGSGCKHQTTALFSGIGQRASLLHGEAVLKDRPENSRFLLKKFEFFWVKGLPLFLSLLPLPAGGKCFKNFFLCNLQMGKLR